MANRTQDGAKADFRRMQLRILLLYILIIVVMSVMLSSVLLGISNRMLSGKVAALIAANSRQMEMNINNYLTNVETTATLLFADKDYYEYDPINSRLSEYQRIKAEEAIASRIVDLALMDSFADFTIVYSTGNRVGLTSNTTAGLYDTTQLYDELARHIEDSERENAWIFGFGDLTDRLYYVKRLNSNAILTASFYTRELSTVFEYPSQLEGMKICLVNDDNTVMYSSDADMINQPLQQSILDVLEGRVSGDDSGYFLNVNSCENGWRVVCYISKSIVFRDTEQMRNMAIAVSILLSVLFSTIGMFLITGVFKPAEETVSNLEEKAVKDRLSGLYNKLAFQDTVTRLLAGVEFGKPQVFIMFDMDNFKTINDTLGHAYGDDVIMRMGHMLGDNFGDRYTIGRLGGDEFAMYIGRECSRQEALDEVIADMDIVFKAFDREYEKEKKQIPISLSVGITVQDDERRFKNLYANADEALYISKHGGKNQYTIYEPKEPESDGEKDV